MSVMDGVKRRKVAEADARLALQRIMGQLAKGLGLDLRWYVEVAPDADAVRVRVEVDGENDLIADVDLMDMPDSIYEAVDGIARRLADRHGVPEHGIEPKQAATGSVIAVVRLEETNAFSLGELPLGTYALVKLKDGHWPDVISQMEEVR